MLDTAKEVAKLDVQGIKIHLLHLLKKNADGQTIRKGLC